MKNNEIIGIIYEINVTLVNSGLIKSDEITVNLTDEEHFFLSKEIVLNPGQNKTISFNWSTLLIKNQQIIIGYYPSNPDTGWNKCNSGSKVFTIYIKDEEKNKATAPGFEIILLLISILIFIFLKEI